MSKAHDVLLEAVIAAVSDMPMTKLAELLESLEPTSTSAKPSSSGGRERRTNDELDNAVECVVSCLELESPLRTAELCKQLKEPRPRLLTTIKRGVETGRIARAEDGRWCLPVAAE